MQSLLRSIIDIESRKVAINKTLEYIGEQCHEGRHPHSVTYLILSYLNLSYRILSNMNIYEVLLSAALYRSALIVTDPSQATRL